MQCQSMRQSMRPLDPPPPTRRISGLPLAIKFREKVSFATCEDLVKCAVGWASATNEAAGSGLKALRSRLAEIGWVALVICPLLSDAIRCANSKIRTVPIGSDDNAGAAAGATGGGGGDRWEEVTEAVGGDRWEEVTEAVGGAGAEAAAVLYRAGPSKPIDVRKHADISATSASAAAPADAGGAVAKYAVRGRVEAKVGTWKQHCPGTVAAVNEDGTYVIEFDDGEVVESVAEGKMRLLEGEEERLRGALDR